MILLIVAATLFLSACTSEKTFKGNFHTHTEDSFDSAMTYEETIEEAIRLGFDFIAITDHSRLDGTTETKCNQETRLLCIMGEELTKQEDHLLGIGMDTEVKAELSNERNIDNLRKQGSLIIAPHPGAENGGLDYDELRELAPKLDAMECWNKRLEDTRYQELMEKLSKEINLPCVYNSDAHKVEALGLISTSCKMESLSIDNLKEAVKQGKCFKSD